MILKTGRLFLECRERFEDRTLSMDEYLDRSNSIFISDLREGDRAVMISTGLFAVPLSAEEFPYPDNFILHQRSGRSVYLSVDIEGIEANRLFYLQSGMNIQIIHPSIVVEVSKSIGCFRARVGEKRYYSNVSVPTSFKADYSYTVANVIARMRILRAFYVPKRGVPSGAHRLFPRSSLSKIRLMAGIQK